MTSHRPGRTLRRNASGSAFAVKEVVLDPVLVGWDLVWILLACIGFGGAGGIAFDLTEPIIRRAVSRAPTATPQPPPGDAEAAFGDNRLAFPRRITVRNRPLLDAGFLGPVFVGAIAAIIAVLLLAVNRPDSPSTIEREALSKTLEAEEIPAESVTAIDEALETRKPYVQWEELIPIALIAGFAGVAVLRTARSRLLTAIGAVALEARTAGIREGATVSAGAAAETARDSSVRTVEPDAEPVLTEAINEAVEEHIEDVTQSSPLGSSGW